MAQADFRAPTARLCDAMRKLEQTWMTTKETWSDSVAEHVQDEFLLPLSGEVRGLVDTVGKLTSVMAKAEQACSHLRERSDFL